MTNNEAIQIVINRVQELKEDKNVKAKCKELFNNGYTAEQIKAYVTQLAIATLIGR